MIALHNEIMERSGVSSAPLIHPDKLGNAILRPQHAAHYEGAEIPQQAAVLGVAVSQAQAFLDGNKRTAFAALRTFLYVNGYRFVENPLELAQQLGAVADRGERSLEDATQFFIEWFCARVAPR